MAGRSDHWPTPAVPSCSRSCRRRASMLARQPAQSATTATPRPSATGSRHTLYLTATYSTSVASAIGRPKKNTTLRRDFRSRGDAWDIGSLRNVRSGLYRPAGEQAVVFRLQDLRDGRGVLKRGAELALAP